MLNEDYDKRHIICFVILWISAFCTYLFFPYCFGRLCETFKDFASSCEYYFKAIVSKPYDVNVTVTQRTAMPFTLPWNLPNTWDEFATLMSNYSALWVSSDNFDRYLDKVADVLLFVSKMLLVVLPIILSAILIATLKDTDINNDYNKDSKALTVFKKFVIKVYNPCKKWVLDFIAFVKEHNVWLKLWLLVWALNFNLIAIAIEAISFYIYFVSSFAFEDLYTQVVKLLFDLGGMFDFVPVIVWIVVAFIVVDKIRRNIGYDKLNHMEMKNRGFLNERPIVSMACGTMGKGKTTFLSSAGVSWEIMFRDKAFELLLDTDMKFPYFPWINIELALRKAMENHTVYNLATCRRFVASKKRKFDKHPTQQNIFCYNYEKYGTTFIDELKVIDIWQALEDYAQLYFIYIIQSSLVVSNYSVRVDNILEDAGNFPLWNTDLFKRRPELKEIYSRHSHILDFDCLRLGKKVIEDNKLANSFEFGVVLITEIGKERGNMLENKDKKKTDDKTNQLNDLFNSELKMIRHAGTVCNYCFVRVLLDEQRPESWGSDGKDLADVIFIKEKSEFNLAMPLFHLEDLVLGFVLNKFQDRYSKYRYEHGNNTLPMYLYHGLASMLYNYRARIYNTFGYQTWTLQVSSGRNELEYDLKDYYLLYRKDYCERFASDAYSDFYVTKSLKSDYGINDLPEYAKTKATIGEFKQQNSFFMNDLFNGLLGEENNKK